MYLSIYSMCRVSICMHTHTKCIQVHTCTYAQNVLHICSKIWCAQVMCVTVNV